MTKETEDSLGRSLISVSCNLQGCQTHVLLSLQLHSNVYFFISSGNKDRLSEQLLSHIQRLEAALLRQQGYQQGLHSQAAATAYRGLGRGEQPYMQQEVQLETADGDVDDAASDEERLNNMLLRDEVRSPSDSQSSSLLSDRLESLRKLRRNFRKRNYNLDHLARMNFRRSFRASSALNNRHILGGL